MAELIVYRGDSKTYTITFDDGTNPIDITGWTVFFTVKNKNDNSSTDDDALITRTVTSHSDPVNGQTQVILSFDDTDIEPGIYKYDFQTISDTGIRTTYNPDSFIVTDDVTKRSS